MAASPTAVRACAGHAQQGVAVWGLAAVELRRRWVRIAVVAPILVLGYSRVQLGAHFVEDVVAGWLAGGLLLLAFLRLRAPVTAWLSARSPRAQIWAVFGVSMALVALGVRVAFRAWQPPTDWIGIEAAAWPIAPSSVVTPAGALFGFGAGLVVLRDRGGFDAGGPVRQRIIRTIVGLAGILLLSRGLGAVLPAGDDVIALVYRYLRYALVGFWVAAVAPLLFLRWAGHASGGARTRHQATGTRRVKAASSV